MYIHMYHTLVSNDGDNYINLLIIFMISKLVIGKPPAKARVFFGFFLSRKWGKLCMYV